MSVEVLKRLERICLIDISTTWFYPKTLLISSDTKGESYHVSSYFHDVRSLQMKWVAQFHWSEIVLHLYGRNRIIIHIHLIPCMEVRYNLKVKTKTAFLIPFVQMHACRCSATFPVRSLTLNFPHQCIEIWSLRYYELSGATSEQLISLRFCFPLVIYLHRIFLATKSIILSYLHIFPFLQISGNISQCIYTQFCLHMVW